MRCKSERIFTKRKEQAMVIFFCFMLIVAEVVIGIDVQRWLFKEPDEVVDPEWELYQQRYD
jgi:hypothetical protein